MDENLTTAGEPTIVESTVTPTDTGIITTNTDMTDGSQVIETSTPMDNNVTYDNIDISNNITDPTVTNITEPNDVTVINPDVSLTDNVYDAIVTHEHDTNLTENSGSAMQNFFLKDYDYDVDEVGSYWVGGAMNDVKNQMSFLNVLINEEMYDALDLQKYYFDNNLATARAYAAKKDKETAYNYYRAAQEKAIAEGELTGWYMPAEGRYMLGQYTVAMNILENPDATPEEKAKADRIKGTTEEWFGANKIGTQGIKTLGMMNYEETVRHNKVTERLQDQANKAAAASAGAANAQLLWDIAEMELVVREDLDKNGVIGHTDTQRKLVNSDLFRYVNTNEAWRGLYKWSESQLYWSDGTAREQARLAGVNYAEMEEKYTKSKDTAIINEAMKKGSTGYIGLDKITKFEGSLSGEITLPDGSVITGSDLNDGYYKIITDIDGETKAYIYAELKTGGTVQITDENFEVNGTKLKDLLTDEDFNHTTSLAKNELRTKDGKFVRIGPNTISDKVSYDFTITNDVTDYNFPEPIMKAIDKYVTKGEYELVTGVIGRQGINDEYVIRKKSSDGNSWKYYQIQDNGDTKEVTDLGDLITVTVENDTERKLVGFGSSNSQEHKENGVSSKVGNTWNNYKKLAHTQFVSTPLQIEINGKTYDVKAYRNSNGKFAYAIEMDAVAFDKEGTLYPENKSTNKTTKGRAHSASNNKKEKTSSSSKAHVLLSQDDLKKMTIKEGSKYTSRGSFEKAYNDYINKKLPEVSNDTTNVLNDAGKEDTVVTTDNDTTSKKLASPGGVSTDFFLTPMNADPSTYDGYTQHLTYMSPDETATQNVLAYGEEEEKAREEKKKKTSTNTVSKQDTEIITI